MEPWFLCECVESVGIYPESEFHVYVCVGVSDLSKKKVSHKCVSCECVMNYYIIVLVSVVIYML